MARSEAAKGLSDAERDVKRALGEIEGATSRSNTALARTGEATGRQLAEAGRITRVLAGDLVAALNPALGETAGALGAATAATRGMSLATGGLVAGLALGGVTLAQYVRTLNEATERQAALNLAVRGLDASAIRQQLAQSALELERSAVRGQRFKEVLEESGLATTGYARALQVLRETFPGLEQRVLSVGRALGILSNAQDEAARQRAALAQVLPIEREIQLAEAYGKQQAALGPLLQVELQRASQTKDLQEFARIHERLRDTFAAEAATAREAALAQGRIAEAQAVARGAPQAELDAIREQIRATVELINTQAVGREKAREFQQEQGRLDIIRRRIEPIPGTLPEGPEGVPETAAQRQQREEISRRTVEGQLELRQRLLDVDQQRNEVLLNIEGLSQREREQLELGVASARERLRLREAEVELEKATLSGDPRRIQIAQSRRDLVELEEAIRRSNLGQGQAERTDLFAGIARGFRDIKDDLESFGRDGERIIRGFASTAHGYFSDLLFAPLEDDWEKALQDTPRRLLQGIGREITDALARFTIGNLVSGAARLFPSVAGVTTAAGVVGAPSAAQAAPGATIQALQVLQSAGQLGSGAQATAGNVVSSLSGLPVSSLLQLAAAGSPSATSLLASAELFAASPDLGLVAGLAGGPGGASAGGASLGALLGAGAGAVGGALGLGFTIFGALQQNPTPTSVALSGLSGAVSGAALAAGLSTLAAAGVFGASIAAAAPSFGVSLAIGAIVGAALGAGAGAAGKGQGPEGAQRQQERAATASQIYNELANAIRDGRSIEQVAATRIHTGNTVGGLLMRMAIMNVQGLLAGQPWLWPPAPGSQKAIDLLASIGAQPEEFNEGRVNSVGELIVNFGEGNPNLGAQRASDLLRDFVAIAEGLEEQIEQAAQNTPFSFVQQVEQEGIGAVSIRTFLPVSRAGEARGRDILLSSDFWRNLPPQVAAALWQRLVEVDFDQNIGVISRRAFSGEI